MSNIDPKDLDANTLRNMNAIGVNFVMKEATKLKAHESISSKARKWRIYDTARNSKRTSP